MMWTRLEDAFGDLPSAARVVAGTACGTPLTLLRGLAEHALRETVVLSAGLLLGEVPLEPALRSGNLRLRSWHVHGGLRRLFREGLVDYLPVRLLDLPEAVLADADVALVRVGPPDADGWCSLGPSTSFAAEAVERARLVIAEVSPDVPRTHGASAVRLDDIDRLVEADVPMAEYVPGPADETSLAVARNVVDLLPRGATVQLGIGTVPECLAGELAGRADELALGLLGMVSEAMVPLATAVAAGGRGPVQAVELLGGSTLMAWADGNASIEMRSSRRLHNPLVLARVPKLVSVNSAVVVDLFGQSVAESVGGSVIAGVGGSADFAEGAHLSEGGFRVIALKSTTRSGASTIVATHDPADTVTACHHSVDVVVTEHGAAWLRGRTRSQRREALISVAAPEHRPVLAERSASLAPSADASR